MSIYDQVDSGDLEQLLRIANLWGWYVMVRTAPGRQMNCFTVLMGKSENLQIRMDTNDPTGVVRRSLQNTYMYKKEKNDG